MREEPSALQFVLWEQQQNACVPPRSAAEATTGDNAHQLFVEALVEGPEVKACLLRLHEQPARGRSVSGWHDVRMKRVRVAICPLGEERRVQVVFHESGQHGTASGLRLEVTER